MSIADLAGVTTAKTSRRKMAMVAPLAGSGRVGADDGEIDGVILDRLGACGEIGDLDEADLDARMLSDWSLRRKRRRSGAPRFQARPVVTRRAA